MPASPVKVEFYVAPDGKVPLSDWLCKLKDSQVRARFRTRLNRVRLGNFGDYKSVGDGVFELRIDYGPGYRIYFGQLGEKFVLLLCGGNKHTQQANIQNAKQYLAEYQGRSNA
jgi:putative addiction module killer protein